MANRAVRDWEDTDRDRSGGGPDSGPIGNLPEHLHARVIADLSALVGEAAATGDAAFAHILGRALMELLGE